MKRNQKTRVFKIFKSGATVADVIKSGVKVSERTLFRWWREYLELSGQARPKKLIEPPTVSEEQINEVTVNVNRKKITIDVQSDVDFNSENFDNEWLAYITKESLKGTVTAGKVCDKLNELLLEELSKPEINTRTVTCLSTAVSSHSRIQREFGLFHLLDPNAAYRILESAGYCVMLPGEVTTTTVTHKRAR